VFQHVLVQVAAYEALLRTTRQRYHERIARVLLSDFNGDVEHQPEAVARHLSGAGHHAEASDYWVAAGNVRCAPGDSRSARALCPRARRPQATARVARES
jgi:predicted ATPase